MRRHLEVVHQAVLAASLLADGEVVAQSAGSVGTVHRVAHRVVEVTGGVPDDASTLRVETTYCLEETVNRQLLIRSRKMAKTTQFNTGPTVFCVTILPAEMATKM